MGHILILPQGEYGLMAPDAVASPRAIPLMISVQFYSHPTTARYLVKGEKLRAISHPCKLATNLRRQTFDNPPVTLWFGGCELHLQNLINGSLPATDETQQLHSAAVYPQQKPASAGEAFRR